uniref:Gpm633 n=1 Tax=Arundo donax TaxID=35708 RepID=A0A0A9ADE2_ARUDO
MISPERRWILEVEIFISHVCYDHEIDPGHLDMIYPELNLMCHLSVCVCIHNMAEVTSI